MPDLNDLRVKIFADGADRDSLLDLAANPLIRGFTTNPTLMRAAGVSDYEGFARDVLAQLDDRPISFEVFSDDFDEMERQGREIARWGDNVYVKIPVTNTLGESSEGVIRTLARAGVKLNVTALLTDARGLLEFASRPVPPGFLERAEKAMAEGTGDWESGDDILARIQAGGDL